MPRRPVSPAPRTCLRESSPAPLAHNPSYSRWFVKDVLRAIRRYGMIGEGERVAVALSGGKDSAALLWMLAYISRFSHLHFTLAAVHVRMGDYDTQPLRELCERAGAAYLEEDLQKRRAGLGKNPCSVCARIKRGAMAGALTREGIRTVAFGHHATDAAETLLMNMVQSRKLGSFSPVVRVDGTPMLIVRPMIYLDEPTVARIHRHAGLPLLAFECPYAHVNVRRRYKEVLRGLGETLGAPDLALRIVSSLENLDQTNRWSDVRVREEDR